MRKEEKRKKEKNKVTKEVRKKTLQEISEITEIIGGRERETDESGFRRETSRILEARWDWITLGSWGAVLEF